MSRTKINNVFMLQDMGATFDSGTGTHTLLFYKAQSGAQVFGAGTCQWSWALDDFHDPDQPNLANMANTRVTWDQSGPDKTIQQATLNLFADMGIQPQVENLSEGLTKATETTDFEPPITE